MLSTMSHLDRPSSADGASLPPDARPSDELSVRQLAHELNSLIDGTMRSMRLAERALAGDSDQQLTEALNRLRTAEGGLEDMAAVITRVLEKSASGVSVFGSNRTLGDECSRIVDRLHPLADRLDVQIMIRLADDVIALPAKTLGGVISNGLHNAILACSIDGLTMRRVELSAARSTAGDELVLHIADTGPGPAAFDREGGRPGGHGLGLGICREIVDRLDGRLDLMPVPFGGGAVLHVQIPLASLEL